MTKLSPTPRIPAHVTNAGYKREDFLNFIAEGHNISSACRSVGWQNTDTYYYHRKKHPNWAARIDATMHAARQGMGKEENLASFSSFVQRYFPDREPPQAQQLRMVAELERLGPREVLLFLLWPQARKTGTLEDFITMTLAKDPGHRFRYISASQDLAKNVIGTVKRRMTDKDEYPAFHERYGPFYQPGQEKHGRVWTQEKIMVQQNPGTERDHNLVASSWTSNVLGARIDTLIVDDVCNQKNLDQSEKILDYIVGTFFSREKLMRTVILGNRIAHGDVYDKMMAAGIITRQVTMPAADPDGHPTVPEAWDVDMFHNGRACCGGDSPFRQCPGNGAKLTPQEYMDLMKHQARDNWWAAYMGNPVASELTTFALYIDRCLDRDRKVGETAA